MQSKPFISVLMTCFNREHFIAASIESVLNSTYKNFELIIVDDNSTDGSKSIAKHYAKSDDRIKFYENKTNLGDYKNRNFAVSLATYDYFTFVDSDDLIFAHTLETMFLAIQKYPNHGAYIMTRNHEPYNPKAYSLSTSEALYNHFFVNGFLETGPLGTLFNKETFNKLGGFSERRMTSDNDYFLRVSLNGPIVRLPSKLGFWRSHNNQESSHGFEYYLLDMILIYKSIINSPDFPLQEYRNRILRKMYFSKIKDVLYRVYKTKNIWDLKYIIKIFTVNEFIV